MIRSSHYTAMLLVLALGPFALVQAISEAQVPATPPGPPVIITPPIVKQPTTAPVETPSEDELKKPFAVVAVFGGVTVTEPVVNVPVGKLLRLTLEGDCMAPDEETGATPKVTWTMSHESSDVENYPPLSDHVTVTSDVDMAILFTASVNNPNGAPFVCQRWVVFGQGPRPPPTTPTTPVKPPVVVDPSTPPVTPTITAVYWVYEKDDGAVPPYMQTAIDRLIREKKIDARPVEEDVEDGTGGTPEGFKIPIAAARAKMLPALVLMTGTEVYDVKKDLKTEAEVLSAVP